MYLFYHDENIVNSPVTDIYKADVFDEMKHFFTAFKISSKFQTSFCSAY